VATASGKTTKGAANGVGPVLAWIGLLWLIYATDVVLTQRVFIEYSQGPWTGGYLQTLFGIKPLTLFGFLCIPTAPLMHASIAHLSANSVGLLILGWPSWRYSPKLTMVAVCEAVVFGGLLAWALGAPGSVHIGASGVIFGLIGFLIGNGIFRRGCMPVLLGLGTALLFLGVLPQALPAHAHDGGMSVSWQMHLGGLLGGLSASWHTRSQER